MFTYLSAVMNSISGDSDRRRLWMKSWVLIILLGLIFSFVGLFFYFISYHRIIKVNIPDRCFAQTGNEYGVFSPRLNVDSPVEYAWGI